MSMTASELYNCVYKKLLANTVTKKGNSETDETSSLKRVILLDALKDQC